jgi:hypothetical protein
VPAGVPSGADLAAGPFAFKGLRPCSASSAGDYNKHKLYVNIYRPMASSTPTNWQAAATVTEACQMAFWNLRFSQR